MPTQGSFAEYRLPPGRHGLPREQVAENQRWRLLGAAGEVVAERGYLRATASDVARCAGVSRGTFYKHFDDLPGCLLATYETAADCVVDLASSACESEGEWEVRLRGAIDAVLEFFVAEPSLACLFSSELAAGVPEVVIARERLTERLRPLLAGGRPSSEGATAELLATAERHLIAGALSIVSDRIAGGEIERLPSLAPALLEALVMPHRATSAG